MKEGLLAPQRLVNLKTIPGLASIEPTPEGWRIGALTTLSRLAEDQSIAGPGEMSVLVQAVTATASPQLRHMATIGGNLLQRPRCWYYRNRLTHCWLKGGDRCFAVRGENRLHAILGRGACQAVHPSDPAVALLALDAEVTVTGRRGRETFPLTELFQRPRPDSRSQTTLGIDQVITHVFIPKPPQGSRGWYARIADRSAWDFALVSAAVQVALDGGIVRQARVVLGAVGPHPWRAEETENRLLGRPLERDTIDAAALVATAGAKPLEQNAYKVGQAQNLVREALRALM
jgi:xanthine dehydrogenase YagS FAD-binding subunit